MRLPMWRGLLVAVALLCTLAQAKQRDFIPQRHLVFTPSDPSFNEHVTTKCNPAVVGSVAACFNSKIAAANIEDFPINDSRVTYPTDGTPWGMHITPYTEGTAYLISWLFSAPIIGANQKMRSCLNHQAKVELMGPKGEKNMVVNAKVINYLRNYTAASNSNASYQSPFLAHAIVMGLKPQTTYKYQASSMGKKGKMASFKTLANTYTDLQGRYPLRIGLMADIGQTENSSITRDHMYMHKPDVIFMTGDNCYADNYDSRDPNLDGGDSSANDRRWDSYHVLWNKVYSTIPQLNCAGNHEIEAGVGIAVAPSNTSFSFKYPTNYPFQAYAARFPPPNLFSGFGNIDTAQWYKTTVGGVATLITLNTYAPFYQGTPQYAWFMAAISSVDRKTYPWLFVQYHTPIYHTYVSHFKEGECFRSIYEPLFYKYRVDVIINGHVHAYERTHPIYNYTIDTCGPIHITIGDGGNIEGPYRNFVDEVNPNTNLTYCETLAYSGKGANDAPVWGPSYQTQVLPAGCPTKSWQTAYSVNGSKVLVPLRNNTDYGFCQSSQPLWSAHRDPSFGHGILELMDSRTGEFTWYRNVDGNMVIADKVVINRAAYGCSNDIPDKPAGKSIYA